MKNCIHDNSRKMETENFEIEKFEIESLHLPRLSTNIQRTKAFIRNREMFEMKVEI